MGKHEEAVVQLEIALRSFPGRTDIHMTLADLYEKLGHTDIARAHREMPEKTDPPE